jgi:hypothetical protein
VLWPGLANGQQVAFAHGFRADGSADSWGYLPQRLADRFPSLSYITPTLGWDRSLRDQGLSLHWEMANAGFSSDAILFGHSNGGLISREATRHRSAKGVITVGTLHGGAPLADNLGALSWWSDILWMFNWMPATYYDWFLWCGGCYYGYEDYGLLWLAVPLDYIMGAWGGAAGFFAAYIGLTTSDALGDMGPGSAFLADLNSDANLGREASQIPVRVGIGSRVSSEFYGIMWQGLLPDHAGWLTAIQYLAAYISLIEFYNWYFYWDYYDPYYWEKTMGAWLWLLAASADFSVDPMWCILMGAWDGWWCGPSDGIVPLDRQRFPGSGAINLDVLGPAHTQEKQSGDVFSTSSWVLQNYFGLSPRY